MIWTEEKLSKLTAKELRNLYDNALAREGEEAALTVALIESLGAPEKQTSLSLDSPLGREMQKVIFSPAGKEAALDAAAAGNAPMAAIDPMLQEALGEKYKGAYEGTVNAGYLVANLMRQHSWETNGKRQKLPENCVAKTAAIFVYIPTKQSSQK